VNRCVLKCFVAVGWMTGLGEDTNMRRR